RRRLLCAGLGVLLARAPSSSAPVTRPSQERVYIVSESAHCFAPRCPCIVAHGSSIHVGPSQSSSERTEARGFVRGGCHRVSRSAVPHDPGRASCGRAGTVRPTRAVG